MQSSIILSGIGEAGGRAIETGLPVVSINADQLIAFLIAITTYEISLYLFIVESFAMLSFRE